MEEANIRRAEPVARTSIVTGSRHNEQARTAEVYRTRRKESALAMIQGQVQEMMARTQLFLLGRVVVGRQV